MKEGRNDFFKKTDLVSYGVAASVFRLCAEGHAAHQLCSCQGRDTVVINSENTKFVVSRRCQVAQQEVLMVGWDHPEREEDTRPFVGPDYCRTSHPQTFEF